MNQTEINETSLRELKSRVLSEIRDVLPRYESRLCHIDTRLWEYACGVVRTDRDVHNIYEVLGLRKFLRMTDTYVMNDAKAKKVINCYEKLEFSGLKGRRRYPLTPIQVYMLCGVMLFTRSLQSGSAFLSEIEDGDSDALDRRRIVTDAVFFIVRKFCKTTMGAFFAFWFMMFEDYNAEIYCVANSGSQSKILFDMARSLLSRLTLMTSAYVRQRVSASGDPGRHARRRWRRSPPAARQRTVCLRSCASPTSLAVPAMSKREATWDSL